MRFVYLVQVQPLYLSYVRAFVKSSRAALDNRSSFKTITPFALIISDKANELVKRAALNSDLDLAKLQKEIFQLGSQYIHQLAHMIRMNDRTGDAAWFLKTCDPKAISKAITRILETSSL